MLCKTCNTDKPQEEFEPKRRVCKKCRYRSHVETRQKRFQKRRDLGTCYYCGTGEPSNGTGLCESCYQRFSYGVTKTKYEYADYYKKYHDKLKQQIFDHYGWTCVCCGETILRFLTIDHMNNNGKQHRKEVGGGNYLYRWLINNKFPEGFQILCFNCNSGRAANGGICPHKQFLMT